MIWTGWEFSTTEVLDNSICVIAVFIIENGRVQPSINKINSTFMDILNGTVLTQWTYQ